jgi:Domain of unknown function (DUF4091)
MKAFYPCLYMVLCALVLGCHREKESITSYRLRVLSPYERVRPDVQELSPSTEYVNGAVIAAARGETVSVQVVVSRPLTDESVVRPLSVEISYDEKGSGISKSMFLATTILVASPSNSYSQSGLYFDALPPLVAPFHFQGPYKQKLFHRVVWVDVTIPLSTPVGRYSFQVRGHGEGGIDEKASFAIDVQDITIPTRGTFVSYMGMYEDWVAPLYQTRAGAPFSRKILDSYYELLLSHRLEPWFTDALTPYVEVSPQGSLTIEFDEDRFHRYLGKRDGLTRMVVLPAPKVLLDEAVSPIPFMSPLYRDVVKKYLTKVKEYLESHGWLDRLIINSPIDEPNSREAYEKIIQWRALVREVLPITPFLITEAPVPQESSWPSLQAPHTYFSSNGGEMIGRADASIVKKVNESGGQMTWYSSCDQAPPYPNFFIDGPVTDPYLIPWITFQRGYKGILYWGINYWEQVVSPWENPNTFISSFYCGDGHVLNGEGSLVYPGVGAQRFSGQPHDGISAISSIRLKLLREGIEDFELLSLLLERDKKAESDALVRELVSSPRSLERDPAVISEVSRRLRALFH